VPGLSPFLLRDLSLEVGKRTWELLHPARVRFFCRELRALVSLLVPGDALVGGASPNLDGDVRSGSS
jgi:hypothetical protein